jgi:NhaP-type Na+/H+ or K+/H+ antiporter
MLSGCMLDPKTPWEIAKWNIVTYWALQIGAWALLFGAILTQHDALLIVFWVNVCVPIIYFWTTARQCKTAYMGRDRDEIREFAVPFLVVAALGVACYHASKTLLR